MHCQVCRRQDRCLQGLVCSLCLESLALGGPGSRDLIGAASRQRPRRGLGLSRPQLVFSLGLAAVAFGAGWVLGDEPAPASTPFHEPATPVSYLTPDVVQAQASRPETAALFAELELGVPGTDRILEEARTRLRDEARAALDTARSGGTDWEAISSAYARALLLSRYRLAVLKDPELPTVEELAVERAQAVWTAVQRGLEKLLAPVDPDWDEVLTAVGKLERMPEFSSAEQQAWFAERKAEANLNRRACRAYKRAVDIVEARVVENYPRAIEELESVVVGARIYQDAQAYLAWIGADLAVRSASQHYRRGDMDQASQLLEQALRVVVLGPEARATVRERSIRWRRVAECFASGQEACESGDEEQALVHFGQVLELESDRSNFFHQQAVRLGQSCDPSFPPVPVKAISEDPSEGGNQPAPDRWNDAEDN